MGTIANVAIYLTATALATTWSRARRKSSRPASRTRPRCACQRAPDALRTVRDWRRVTANRVEASETTEREIDIAVREIVAKALDRATEVLRARRADLDQGARLLLAQETVTADQFPAIRPTAAKAAPAAQGAQP